MHKIHSSVDPTAIHNLKNALETNGIQCEVLGEFRRGLMGEVPMSESFVELWIVDDAQAEAAREIFSGSRPASSVPWTCPGCGEDIEAEFDECWKCQTGRTEEAK